MSQNHLFRIGCSGYYYPSWKNKFYPPKLQPRDWLTYYSSVFNTVELNGTFYRTPKLTDLQRYASKTPDDFTFSVKVSRYITHVMKLKDSRQSILDFKSLIEEGLGHKLQYMLFQMPPSFQYNKDNLGLVLDQVPNNPQCVVELRHPSWWNGAVEKAFKEAGLTFCNVDFPGMETFFIHTSPVFYLRMHGNPVLFKSSYSDEELARFYKQFPKNGKQYNIYFNNTYYEAAYQNAHELIRLTGLK